MADILSPHMELEPSVSAIFTVKLWCYKTMRLHYFFGRQNFQKIE